MIDFNYKGIIIHCGVQKMRARAISTDAVGKEKEARGFRYYSEKVVKAGIFNGNNGLFDISMFQRLAKLKTVFEFFLHGKFKQVGKDWQFTEQDGNRTLFLLKAQKEEVQYLRLYIGEGNNGLVDNYYDLFDATLIDKALGKALQFME